MVVNITYPENTSAENTYATGIAQSVISDSNLPKQIITIGNADYMGAKYTDETNSEIENYQDVVYPNTQACVSAGLEQINADNGWSEYWQVEDYGLFFGGKPIMLNASEQSEQTAYGVMNEFDAEKGAHKAVETIKVDLKNPNMPSGTPMNEKMVKISNELDRFFQIIREKQVELQREYPKQDDFKTQYVSFYKAWKKDLIDRSFELFKEHNNDVIGEFLMRSGCFPYLSLEEQESLFLMFGDWLKSRRIVQMHIRRIESLKATAEGKMFVDIIGKDLNGKDIALADYVGKGDYVLMDFWASWCKPCREETPYLVKLYEQFKDKGLTIVGVFVSDKKENLKKVVEEENIGWPQLYDDKNMAMDLYGVNGIPHIILFAPDGTILKRDLRGNMMIETVTKLLTEK
jgi:thiol-disulfide isomerase/thioredoxin